MRSAVSRGSWSPWWKNSEEFFKLLAIWQSFCRVNTRVIPLKKWIESCKKMVNVCHTKLSLVDRVIIIIIWYTIYLVSLPPEGPKNTHYINNCADIYLALPRMNWGRPAGLTSTSSIGSGQDSSPKPYDCKARTLTLPLVWLSRDNQGLSDYCVILCWKVSGQIATWMLKDATLSMVHKIMQFFLSL